MLRSYDIIIMIKNSVNQCKSGSRSRSRHLFLTHIFNVFLLWLDTIDLVRDLSMPLDICFFQCIHVSCVEYYDQYLSGLGSRS